MLAYSRNCCTADDGLALRPDDFDALAEETVGVDDTPEDENAPENETDIANSGHTFSEPAKGMPRGEAKKTRLFNGRGHIERGNICPISEVQEKIAGNGDAAAIVYEYRITPSSTVPKRSVTISSA